jgi:uncharacterized protein YutE (UPF0331/DUF86 family)
MMAIRELLRLNIFSEQDAAKIEELRQLRNKVMHGGVDFRSAISRQTVADVRGIVERYSAALPPV